MKIFPRNIFQILMWKDDPAYQEEKKSQNIKFKAICFQNGDFQIEKMDQKSSKSEVMDFTKKTFAKPLLAFLDRNQIDQKEYINNYMSGKVKGILFKGIPTSPQVILITNGAIIALHVKTWDDVTLEVDDHDSNGIIFK